MRFLLVLCPIVRSIMPTCVKRSGRGRRKFENTGLRPHSEQEVKATVLGPRSKNCTAPNALFGTTGRIEKLQNWASCNIFLLKYQVNHLNKQA